MKSQFYSKSLFKAFITINTIAILIALFYCCIILIFNGLASPSEGEQLNTIIIFTGIIPVLYIICSMLIIRMQQNGKKKWDYFMAPLLIIPCAYFIYFLNYKYSVDFFQFFFFIPERSIFSNLLFSTISTIFILSSLIPFYAFGKVLMRDLSKRKS